MLCGRHGSHRGVTPRSCPPCLADCKPCSPSRRRSGRCRERVTSEGDRAGRAEIEEGSCTDGIDTPESACCDAGSNTLFVSRIAGSPTQKDHWAGSRGRPRGQGHRGQVGGRPQCAQGHALRQRQPRCRLRPLRAPEVGAGSRRSRAPRAGRAQDAFARRPAGRPSRRVDAGRRDVAMRSPGLAAGQAGEPGPAGPGSRPAPRASAGSRVRADARSRGSCQRSPCLPYLAGAWWMPYLGLARRGWYRP